AWRALRGDTDSFARSGGRVAEMGDRIGSASCCSRIPGGCIGNGGNRGARALRCPGEFGRPCLAHIAGLVVEILDADPRQASQTQAVSDDLVRPLVVNVDLEGSRIAGDEDRLPDRLE